MESHPYSPSVAIATKYAPRGLTSRLALRPQTVELDEFDPDHGELRGVVDTVDPRILCILYVDVEGHDVDVGVRLDDGDVEGALEFWLELHDACEFDGSDEAADLLQRIAAEASEALDVLERLAHQIAGERREPSQEERNEAENAGVGDALVGRVDYLRAAVGSWR